MKFNYRKFPRSSDSSKPHIAMPVVPAVLSRGAASTLPFFALLDSGADSVIMPSDFAQALGVGDITSGRLERTLGVGGQLVDVYFHSDIEIQLLGDSRRLSVEVGFIENAAGRKVPPLLGRTFFAHFKSVNFEQIKEVIELKI